MINRSKSAGVGTPDIEGGNTSGLSNSNNAKNKTKVTANNSKRKPLITCIMGKQAISIAFLMVVVVRVHCGGPSSSRKLVELAPQQKFYQIYEYTLPLVKGLCPNQVRVGDKLDGGWWICGESSIVPTNGNCVVYSFGINDNFSFDHSLAAQGCQVHGFDPSPYGLHSRQTYEEVERAHYHSFGLGSTDQTYGVGQVPFRWPGLGFLTEGNTAQWQLYTLPTIMKQLNHEQLTILKIDIEGGEWDAINDIIHADWQELYLELHFPPNAYLINRSYGNLNIVSRHSYTRNYFTTPAARNSPGKIDRIHILQQIHTVADLFHWDINYNCREFGGECAEVYFKRRKTNRNKQQLLQTPPSQPNQFYLVD